MSARDFIHETLLPKLERELADEAGGNKHYLAGFEGALKFEIIHHGFGVIHKLSPRFLGLLP